MTAKGSRMRAWQYAEAVKASCPIKRTSSHEIFPAAICRMYMRH